MFTMFQRVLCVLFLLFCTYIVHINSEISCPGYNDLPACSCFVLDDQLNVQCSSSDISSLTQSLSVLNGPVQSFSVYELESRTSVLPNGLTDNVTSPILSFSLSHSSIEDLGEWSLRGLSKSLESLGITGSKLKYVPRSTLTTLKRLKYIDFEGNLIYELGPYSFHNILLQKINLKGNQLENVSENAFWGLEETLMELDMSENKLKFFPYESLSRLRLLSSLNLAWNELVDLNSLSTEGTLREFNRKNISSSASVLLDSEWPLLKYLNLNSNYLKELKSDTFGTMRNLRSVSIHLNSIEKIEETAFRGLGNLETLDLSHNKLTGLPSRVFSFTTKIGTIDLSNNYLAQIEDGVFSNLEELKELFLNGNNLLKLYSPTFSGSLKLSTLHLQQNSLKFLESGIFSPLKNLSELRLSDNFLRLIPQDLFSSNSQLLSLSLDSNLLSKVVPNTFTHCANLRELRLQNNYITTIPYGVLENVPSLEEVHLENNRLSLVQGLSSLKSLRHMSLSRNHIERLSADLLPSSGLSSFSLGHNQIRLIEDGTFANQSSLTILYLGSNNLEWLSWRSLSGLKSLERLYLQKNNLSSLDSETFTKSTKGLMYVDLSFNSLRVIPPRIFQSLLFIEEINLSHNGILSVDDYSFSDLRSLRIVDLSFNKISTFDYGASFGINSGVQILKLGSNLLADFNQGAATKIQLKELDLRDNYLNSYSLKQLKIPSLEFLQISANNLTDIDENMLAGFPNLNFLGADKCSITSLPPSIFSSNQFLSVLHLAENFLTWLPDTVFSGEKNRHLQIRELHLRNNKFRNFPYKALANCSSLQVLTLGGNKIASLELSRVRFPKLKQFDLHDNKVNKIIGTSLGRSMPNLEVIDLGLNNLSKLNEEFFTNVSVTQINLSWNNFQRSPYCLGAIKNAFVLNMSGNPLVNFYSENHSDDGKVNVMDFYLSDTNVTFLASEEFGIYPVLHRLVIKRNPIQVVPPFAFEPLINLNFLDLSENEIETISTDGLRGLTALKSLNLSHNRIKTLNSFHTHLGGLQDLDLSFNELSSLLPDVFSSLYSLVSIRFRGNWISTLSPSLFSPLQRLTILDISHNYIEIIPLPTLAILETRISVLRLGENPLSCECESVEFWEWVQGHPKIFLSSSNGEGGEVDFVCQKPEEVKGRLMKDSDFQTLCSSPLILKLAIQDVRPSSAVVSWVGRNSSSMGGYVVAYHALSQNDVVRMRPLPPSSQYYLLPDLESDTPYLICVLGLNHGGNVSTLTPLSSTSASLLLRDSPLSKCAQVRTLEEDDGYIISAKSSIVHRRLGVLIGALVGIIVFIIFITTLACIKIRKRRELRHQQNGNGGGGLNGVSCKIDCRVSDVIPSTNHVGTIGTYPPHSAPYSNHSTYGTHLRPNGNTNSPGHMSPDFLSYRHYSLAPSENPSHGGGEQERL